MGLILWEGISRLLSTRSQCTHILIKDVYYFSTLPRITDLRGRVSRSYQKHHHDLGMCQFVFSSSQGPRMLFLCLWLFLLFIHVIQKNWTKGCCPGRIREPVLSMGLRRNTSFLCVFLTPSFGKKKNSMGFYISCNIWVGDKNPAKSK